MKTNTMRIISGIILSWIFAEAVYVGAFIVSHNKPEDRDEQLIETVALEAPSAVVEPCEGIVAPIEETTNAMETLEETESTDSVETVESFTADAPVYEIDEIVTTGCVDHNEGKNPGVLYFDVPLEEKLQDHIFALCDESGIDPAIVVAIIDRESKFTADAIGDRGRSYGLMQIQPRWHEARMEKLGVTDLLDPYQNVTVGIDILGELVDSGRSIEESLMIYNGGYALANKHKEAGTLSDYATYVLNYASELERK